MGDKFWNALEVRRIVLDPTEIATTLLFRGANPESLGIFVRLLPYVLNGPVQFDVLHRLAGVSSRRFKTRWDDVRLFMKETPEGSNCWELAENDAVSVRFVTTTRPALRHMLDRLIEYWGPVCVYCGAGDSPLQVEHIVPRSRGGSDEITNLTVACRPCNIRKSTKTAAEFGFPDVLERAKGSF